MKKDKILLAIEDIQDIPKYKELGISNFLVPLKDYSIGYKSFSFEEISKIEDNVYVLANRILTDEDIDDFLKLKVPKNVKGFIIEDTGLYYALKETDYELINFQNHLNNNYETINFWLERFDSLVISTDITKDEIIKVTEKAAKPLILNTFGYPMIMYSRRTLIKNFGKHYDLDLSNNLEIEEKISKNKFILKEDKYGTAVFNSSISDYRSIIKDLPDNKIKYYMVFAQGLDFDTIKKVINNEEVENTCEGFLNKKTIYRVGDIK